MAEWPKKIIPWSPKGKTESPGVNPVLATSYYPYGCFYKFYHNINYLHFPKYQKPREFFCLNLLLLSNESLLLTLQNCYLLIRTFRNTQ